ncbi:hypothetical protein CGRA01v4_13482 [Colletotrichum graminicola]|nr:hypothetical protein CGRA01v4_13482 [Colletotrichum graminicola]
MTDIDIRPGSTVLLSLPGRSVVQNKRKNKEKKSLQPTRRYLHSIPVYPTLLQYPSRPRKIRPEVPRSKDRQRYVPILYPGQTLHLPPPPHRSHFPHLPPSLLPPRLLLLLLSGAGPFLLRGSLLPPSFLPFSLLSSHSFWTHVLSPPPPPPPYAILLPT